MSRINIDQLCRDFEACLGWPYKTPGTNDERGIDCSGMFVRGYRLQGASIYHGSNTIWRQHLGAKGKIVGTGDLKKGMAVFKWKPEGDPQRDGQGFIIIVIWLTEKGLLFHIPGIPNRHCQCASYHVRNHYHNHKMKFLYLLNHAGIFIFTVQGLT